MTERILKVFLKDEYVGDLIERNGKQILFKYDLNAKNAISLSMPISSKEYHSKIARPFFENLLPEGKIKDFVAKTYHVSKDNPFSMLNVIGEDCAGAISIKKDLQDDKYELPKTISKDEFNSMIISGAKQIFYKKGTRLSLAGAQNKTTIIINEGLFYVPNYNHPSTHIIKFDNKSFKDILVNEAFCTELAKKLKLPVSKMEYRDELETPYLLIERFDRKKINGKIERIHQEDFCQILSVYPSNKYQTEGGPSFKTIVHAINKYSKSSARGTMLLAKIAVFNFLIGNCEYHGKNLSIIL